MKSTVLFANSDIPPLHALMFWRHKMGQQDSQNNAQALKLKEELEHGTSTAMNIELG